MSDIYVFGPNDDTNDYSSFGLVGALLPTEATFTEAGNGESSVSLTCPLDEFGRYAALAKGNILLCPVPVRTTPEIQNGSCVTTVWTYKVKPLNQLTNKKQRTLYKKQKGSSRLKIMNAGDIVTVVLKPTSSSSSETRWKVKSPYGTGWIIPDGFELVTEKKIDNNANAIQEVQSPWTVQPQRFRIYEIEKTIDEVTVQARHISYDLLYNMTTYKSDESVTLQTALDGVLNNCINKDHGFTAYTNVANEQAGLAYNGKNPIDAMLDPEEGLCAKYKVNLIRDNDELFFLNDPGMNRGVKISYGKNMTGVSYTVSDDSVATRILPVGENKDGTPLYLSDNESERYIDSTRINDYPVVHVYQLDCDNCKVGQKDSNGSKVTVAVARARMKQQAEDLLATGVDLPTIKMEVEYTNLGDTEEYAQFKNLENCFLYDYLIIQHGKQDINVTAQIQEIEWDILTDMMKSVTIGSVGETLANMGITTWQIPAGFSGSKIAPGTVGGGALREDAISTRHLQADSINASVIAAHSITADRLDATTVNAMTIEAVSAKINELVAGQITTDQLYVDLATIAKAQITAANIDEANIDWATINTLSAQIATIAKAEIAKADITLAQIDGLEAKIAEITIAEIGKATIHSAQIDDLEATTAEIVTAKIATAEIDGAQIKDATIGTAKIALGAITSALIDAGAIGTAQIADGSITEAKIVSLNADVITAGTLSVDRLLIKGPNGLFRAINATDEGLTVEELSEEQYQNGMSGTVIVARSITADKIAAKSITANEILGNTITAAEINVANLFADEATIAALDTYLLKTSTIEALEGKLDIWASDKITLAVKDKADASDLTALEGRMDTAESTITLQAEEIAARVTKTTYDTNMANKADKNDLDDLTTRVTTAESNITQNAEEIKSKVTQVAFDSLSERVTTAESNITQNADAIKLKVSQSEFDAMSIGGTNLVKGTRNMTSSNWYGMTGTGKALVALDNDFTGEKIERSGLTSAAYTSCYTKTENVVTAGKVYILSADTYIDSSGTTLDGNASLTLVFYSAAGANLQSTAARLTADSPTGVWKRLEIKATAPANAVYAQATMMLSKNGNVTFARIKMEEGTKPTAWSPAPEDAEENISSLRSEIELVPGQISAAVSAVQVGGTNLVKLANFSIVNASGNANAYLGKNWYRESEYQTTISAYSGVCWLQSTDILITAGRKYTLSYYAWIQPGATAGAVTFRPNLWTGTSDGDKYLTNFISFVVGTPTKYSVTFDTTGWTTGTYTLRFVMMEGQTHEVYFTDIKLEEGTKATAWSPNPAEVRIGSSIRMDVNHTEINTPYLDIDVAGTDGDMHIDENGISAGTATFTTVNCPDLVRYYTGPTSITLAAGGDLSVVAETFRNKLIRENITITVTGDISGRAVFTGICGRGNITIQGGSHTLSGCVIMINNAVGIEIYNLTISRAYERQCVNIEKCTYVKLYGCVLNGNNTPSNAQGIRATYTGLFLQNCEFYNIPDSAMAFSYGTDALVIASKGAATYFLWTDGCTARFTSSRPSGQWASGNPSFLLPSDPAALTIDTGSAKPVETPVTTASYTATTTGTYYPSGHWINDSIIRQGHEGTGSNGRKDYGCMWFGASALSGKTIKSATLTIKRIAGKGRSSSVTMKLWTTTVTGKSGTMASSTLTSLGEIGKIANGETVTVSIPTSAISTIAAGGGLVLYTEETTNKTGKTYSENYAHFEGTDGSAPVLTVTYQ